MAKKKPREINNDLIAYYRVGEHDTALDSLHIQKIRVEDFANKYGFVIKNTWVEDEHPCKSIEEKTVLEKAFQEAEKVGGQVISASLCRMFSSADEYLHCKNSVDKRFIVAETKGLDPKLDRNQTKVMTNMLFTMQMSVYEKYLSDCKEWL